MRGPTYRYGAIQDGGARSRLRELAPIRLAAQLVGDAHRIRLLPVNTLYPAPSRHERREVLRAGRQAAEVVIAN